jgi:hypothetical protein
MQPHQRCEVCVCCAMKHARDSTQTVPHLQQNERAVGTRKDVETKNFEAVRHRHEELRMRLATRTRHEQRNGLRRRCGLCNWGSRTSLSPYARARH